MSSHTATHFQLRLGHCQLSRTRGYQISRKLRHRIEHLFGEAKLTHGLGRARYRGLAKMNEQATLTAIAQNLKRLVKFLNPHFPDR